MLNIKIDTQGLNKLQKHIEIVEQLLKIKNDKNFQQFLQEKVMEVVKRITNERLVGGTSNDEEIDLYKNSHHIEETDNGFILYNDAKIPADKYNTIPFNTSGYPNGMFSIALAFEYGTGVIGIMTGNSKSWNYNDINSSKSKNRKGQMWYLPKNVYGESGILYSGYMGFEIYRYTEIECKARMSEWVNEYLSKEVQ